MDLTLNAVPTRKLVLLAEDDEVFRRLLAKKLTAAGFEVLQAANGFEAKNIFDLSLELFTLVITDVRMPKVDGVQLLTHIRKTAKVPVVIMTGFSEILESKAALDLGANGFLPKPFKIDTFLDVINGVIDPALKPPVEDVSPKYCQIHISEFISSTHLISDLYIKLSDTKFVKVAHKGDAIPMDRLKVYQERKVDFLYVALEEFGKYVDFNVKVSSRAFHSNQLSKELKLKLLQNTTQTLVEKCFISEIDLATLNPAKQMLENSLQLVSEDSEILELMAAFENHSNKLYSHSAAVSFFASMIAREHGWTSASTLFKVSIAALLHDIGKRELPQELLEKSRLQLSATEIKYIETHPLRGRDILAKVESLPDDIGVIIAQHHENIFGSGYPLRIKGDAVHPIARLIAVADRFCELIMPLDPKVPKSTPKEAALRLKKFYADELDSDFVNDLLKVLKVVEAPVNRLVAMKAG